MELSPPHQPQTQLIRRVKAIIEVPVKEEEYSDYEGLQSTTGSGSEYAPEEAKPTTTPQSMRRPSTAKGKQKRRYIESGDEGEENDGRQEYPSDGDDQLLLGSEASLHPHTA